MKVEFIDHMGNDISIVNAARCSFHKVSSYDENGNILEADVKLINYLAAHGHWTPFTHASVSFRVTMPIYVARQLAKHQIGGSVNEVSRRYVDYGITLDVPTQWRKRAENVKQGSASGVVPMDSSMNSLIEKTMNGCIQLYEDLLLSGVCPEQARAVLPVCTETTWVWTGSVAFFARVCNQRLDVHAQKETADVAREIDAYMVKLFPVSWKALRSGHV